MVWPVRATKPRASNREPLYSSVVLSHKQMFLDAVGVAEKLWFDHCLSIICGLMPNVSCRCLNQQQLSVQVYLQVFDCFWLDPMASIQIVRCHQKVSTGGTSPRSAINAIDKSWLSPAAMCFPGKNKGGLWLANQIHH